MKLLLLTCLATLAGPPATLPIGQLGPATVVAPCLAEVVEAPSDTIGLRPLRSRRLEELRFTPPAIESGRAPWDIDLIVARGVGSPSVQESTAVRAVASAFRFLALPGSLLIAGSLYGAGELADRADLSELGLHTGQAVVVAGASTLVGKLIVGRARPHHSPDDPFDLRLGRGIAGDRYQSFPSAHTAAAFATASYIGSALSTRHAGTGIWLNPLLYGGATLAGVSRLFHQEHWLTDIAAGAAIGTVAGRQTARYHR